MDGCVGPKPQPRIQDKAGHCAHGRGDVGKLWSVTRRAARGQGCRTPQHPLSGTVGRRKSLSTVVIARRLEGLSVEEAEACVIIQQFLGQKNCPMNVNECAEL